MFALCCQVNCFRIIKTQVLPVSPRGVKLTVSTVFATWTKNAIVHFCKMLYDGINTIMNANSNTFDNQFTKQRRFQANSNNVLNYLCLQHSFSMFHFFPFLLTSQTLPKLDWQQSHSSIFLDHNGKVNANRQLILV